MSSDQSTQRLPKGQWNHHLQHPRKGGKERQGTRRRSRGNGEAPPKGPEPTEAVG